jgi:hypothetical protein
MTLPDSDYCKTHDAPFYGEKCPACINDHNSEIDGDIAMYGIRLAAIVKDYNEKAEIKIAPDLINQIEKLTAEYKQGE